MRRVDVAIVGGGLAGSLAALSLGRAGVSAVLVDPHSFYPSEQRWQRLTAPHLDLLKTLGAAPAVEAAATATEQQWEMRFGQLLDAIPERRLGMSYDDLVHAVRGAIPLTVEHVAAKALRAKTTPDHQILTLANGVDIHARLIVLATGPGSGLRHALGIARTITHEHFSSTISFDIRPIGRDAFDFPALTHWSYRTSDRLAYLSLFPVGRTMRANLVTYREKDEAWLKLLRRHPEAALAEAMPGLAAVLQSFRVDGIVRIRQNDLADSTNVRRAGVVLIGDAFMTTCPASISSMTKALTDVAQLATMHIPRWLATSGMADDKIAAFYDDGTKRAADAAAVAASHEMKALALSDDRFYRVQRKALYASSLVRGKLRRFLPHSSSPPTTPVTPSPRHGRVAQD